VRFGARNKSSNEKTPGSDFTSQYRFSPGFRGANASAHFPSEYGADFGTVVGAGFAAFLFAAGFATGFPAVVLRFCLSVFRRLPSAI
jgi:hypothetical protein